MSRPPAGEYGVSHDRLRAVRIDDVWQFADGHLYPPIGQLLCPVRDDTGVIKGYSVTETINDVLEGADCKRCACRFTFPPGREPVAD